MKKWLEEMSLKAEATGGNVAMGDLFNPEFMQANSDCKDIDALFEAGGFRVESQADFEAITDEQMNPVIQKHTRSNNWQEFASEAVAERARRIVIVRVASFIKPIIAFGMRMANSTNSPL